jgi:hypothetical protein
MLVGKNLRINIKVKIFFDIFICRNFFTIHNRNVCLKKRLNENFLQQDCLLLFFQRVYFFAEKYYKRKKFFFY